MLRLATRLLKWDWLNFTGSQAKKNISKQPNILLKNEVILQGYDPNSKDPWKNGAYWQDHKPVSGAE